MILASSGRESEGEFTPPPLKRARLSADSSTGGPSGSGSSSGASNNLADSAMQSDHLNCKKKGGHSNGVISESGSVRSGMANGYSKLDGGAQNGEFEEDHLEHRRKRDQRHMTTMEKDIISLIGQHLRERGYG